MSFDTTRFFKHDINFENLTAAKIEVGLSDESLANFVLDLLKNLDLTDPQDESVYTGNTGIFCLFLKFYEFCQAKNDQKTLEKLQRYLKFLPEPQKRLHRCSFMTGKSGVYAANCHLALILQNFEKFDSNLDKILAIHEKDSFRDSEILYGRAGYLCSIFYVIHNAKKYWTASQVENLKQKCLPVVSQQIQKLYQTGYSQSWPNSAHRQKTGCVLYYEWYDESYTGAAHGFSGIFSSILGIGVGR